MSIAARFSRLWISTLRPGLSHRLGSGCWHFEVFFCPYF